jgi:SLOG in TRPM, prokaryote
MVEEHRMTTPFSLHFAGSPTAMALHVDQPCELPAALAELGLQAPRPVVVIVGGAGGLDPPDLDRLRALFESGLVPVMTRLGATAIDGGTWSGVMRLLGEARSRAGADFPLVGVAAAGTVTLPGQRPQDDTALLDPNHTHFVLVPGDHWGAEAGWIARVATELAGGTPSITVVVNGGEIAYSDVKRSLDVGRPVLTIAGSGRTADQLAAAVRDGPADERAVALAKTGLVQAVSAEDTSRLARMLTAALAGPAAGEPASAGRQPRKR